MEPDIERYTGSDAINKHYNMNRLMSQRYFVLAPTATTLRI